MPQTIMVLREGAASVRLRTLSKCAVSERQNGQIRLYGGLRFGHNERAGIATRSMIVVVVRIAGHVVLSMVLVVFVVVLIAMVTITSMHRLDDRGRFTWAERIRVRMVHATPCQHVPQDGAKCENADQAVHGNLGTETTIAFIVYAVPL